MDEMYQAQQPEGDAGFVIDLREIVMLLWSRILWIVLAVAVCVAGAFAITKVTEKPEYRSNTTLYFVCSHSNPSTAVAVATFQAKDFADMATTQNVLDAVSENLGLGFDHSTLASMITVDYEGESRTVNISVKDRYPNRAQTILDEVCRVTKQMSIDRSGAADSTMVFGSSSVADRVDSPLVRNLLIAFIIGLIGSVGVIFVVYLLDDKIKSPDTVQRVLGVGTLGTIPYQREKEEKLGGEG